MKEEEWLGTTDTIAMAAHVCTQLRATRTKIGRRKLRLFVCACLRQVWDLFSDPRERDAIVVCERVAEGQATASELEAARRASFTHALDQSPFGTHTGLAINYGTGKTLTEEAITRCIVQARGARCVGPEITGTGFPVNSAEWQTAARVQADLLREIFGNPFRPLEFDPGWQTSTVMQLATGIYNDRRFDTMPILADALQDAGCDNTDILNHLRDSEAMHVRGCWALDLVLGKS
jgi:hypothetical protein